MNKKISILLIATCLAACSSSRKPSYVITESSENKTPSWVENLRKFEKKKENDSEKYKYFKAEGNSINRRLCEKSAIDNTNVAIASEISTEINNLYTGLTSVENESMLTNDNKKEETTALVKNKLSGVEPRESYWERRKFSVELGADEDKSVFYCYQLSRVNRKTHDKIINEMIEKNLKTIKNPEERVDAKKVVEENAKKADIDLKLK